MEAAAAQYGISQVNLRSWLYIKNTMPRLNRAACSATTPHTSILGAPVRDASGWNMQQMSSPKVVQQKIPIVISRRYILPRRKAR